jgi:hypothetical protein
MAKIKRWTTIKLIRWASRGWDASYSAYVRCDQGKLPWKYHSFWSWVGSRIEHIALPLARRLDPENKWMGAEMAEHGWWG